MEDDSFDSLMAKQPRYPGERSRPFLCTRCKHPFSADNVGFIDREGLPVHDSCGDPGESDEYAHANGGNGYKLHPKYFPAWHRK